MIFIYSIDEHKVLGCYFEGGTWSVEVLGVWEVRRDKACPKIFQRLQS